jgi:membrane-bound lytic murein transglycosylase D
MKHLVLAFCALIAINFSMQAQGNRYRGNKESEGETVNTRLATGSIQVTAPQLPNAYTLFGEKVPMQDQDVRERFDRELIINTYMQGSTVQIIKQMGRWFPMIEERLKANGVPDDFKYLCVAESALNTTAASGVGASGFWQFMKGTAPSYGLEVNDNVDERYNVLKSTDAACAYLKQAYAKLGSWTAAAASYNCGMGGYNGQANAQGTYNFYNLWLPNETMRYIYRILALKYILENTSRSGYAISKADMYPAYDARVMKLNYSIPSLVQFALENGTTYKMIKTYNPWLRDKSLKNSSGKMYEILLPKN